MRRTHLSSFLLLVLLCLGACAPEPESPLAAEPWPERLSDWQLFSLENTALTLADDSIAYSLATPLFSDFALKLRTLRLPGPEPAQYVDAESLAFPLGTVLSKTFYYPRDATTGMLLQTEAELLDFDGRQLQLNDLLLIETRLLVHTDSGWQALPYIWDTEQQDAWLDITGAIRRLPITDGDTTQTLLYLVPNQNECASCHAIDQAGNRLQPLGPRLRHLNRDLAWPPGVNQLTYWQQQAVLDALPAPPAQLPADPVWQPGADDNIEARARAWLDVNCGHCHQPGAAADTSALFLHASENNVLRLGQCKPPIAAGRGTGGHQFSIVPGQPEASILHYRIKSTEPGILMPELGRSLVQDSAVALIAQWIAELPGSCD